jgi:hypothetical protein
MAAEKNFIASLFDLSFSEFVTPRMIKYLFILIMVITGILALVSLVMSLMAGQIWMIIVVPIGFLINLIVARMWLELVMVFFRIMRQVDAIAADKGVSVAGGGSPVPPAPPSPIA